MLANMAHHPHAMKRTVPIFNRNVLIFKQIFLHRPAASRLNNKRKNISIMPKVLRRADLRHLLHHDSKAAALILDGMAAEGVHGCILLERLRFGPPECWKAWQPQQGLVAVKLWPRDVQCERINPTVRMTVPHPALVALTGWGERWERRPWVEGNVLGARCLSQKQYGMIEAAVLALHATGQAHGDLTPANIIVTGNHSVRLIDSGELCEGTPGWCPPEPHTPQHRDQFALTLLRCRVGAENPPPDG